VEDSTGLPEGALTEIFRDPLGVLRRRWKAMALVTLAGVAATAAVTALEQPTYLARATVMISSQKLSEDFVRPTIQEDALERMNALVGEALSRRNLLEILEKHDLYPELRAQGRENEALGMLRGGIQVELDKSEVAGGGHQSARILSIGYRTTDRTHAADVANDVAQLFTLAGIRLRTEQARLTVEFMRRELETAETALREQSRKISEFQQQHMGELPSELESHLRRLERLQQQRNSLAAQIGESETRAAMFAAEMSDRGSSPAGSIQDLRGQLARELAVNKETHPNVIALRRQIELADRNVGGSGSAMGRVGIEAARREADLLREQLAQTDVELKELDAKVAAIPARQEELSALQQREQVLRENYLEFLRKVKEAELAENLERAQQGERVAVLDAAVPPSHPERERWKLAAAGLVASLGLGALLAVFLEWRDPILASREAVEAASGLPVLGSVPHIA
jgi:uncharacterized protein involved in exopolysaccharide biosynthesis